VEEIMALHVLEHLPYARGRMAMQRWYEVLQPGGTIMLVVPDVLVTIERWLEAYRNNSPTLWGFRSHGIWGDQSEPGQFHMWGYDTKSLAALMQSNHFQDITTEPFEGFDGDLGDLVPGLCILARGHK
jgi:predicted SAM-dependent methyltransferase